MRWLVTGGAGYIGAHVVRRLRAARHVVVVLDDLSCGRAGRLPRDVPLVVSTVRDRRAVAWALRRHALTGVVHLAARKSPAESVSRPELYYEENVGGFLAVLQAMSDAGVRRLVYSSSAAVYGAPPPGPVDEGDRTAPINPYGHSKLLGEQLLRAAGTGTGLSWVALRYFNVSGAAHASLADATPTGLFPLLFDAVVSRRPFTVTGTDYPTADGSAVRDYVHVDDVARAHLAAMARLRAGAAPQAVFNVGTGNGHSVYEVVRSVEAVTGRAVPCRTGPRRAGDPPAVVADIARIRCELGWRPRRTLPEMVASMWPAWQPRPGRAALAGATDPGAPR
ncbi:UDP-glucose 4-epimerase GalE [Couchioplanes azureus]|uniref:UDP-glucose 4-epimerase GalE n=1 Tax=Couchioplanes caeruleus TaxID=56438 RepID=UPI001670F977|nr:UDP-glucose 4-epimerase GalE [Couchioplanes caeruleus]GGQ74695.1 UDP-glucose 4-epimerase GalE [Couchioplanes caeruleus subsp. azureus]